MEAATWEKLRAGLHPSPGRPPSRSGTPRVAALGSRLKAGWRLDQLWRAVASDLDCGLHALAARPLAAIAPHRGAPEFETSVSDSSMTATLNWQDATGEAVEFLDALMAGPPSALQVVWGPRDGRALHPAPGEVIGRDASRGAPQVALYRGAPAIDRFLSRKQLVWRGGGAVELRASAMLYREGQRQRVPAGPFVLRAGDLLALTHATWLRAVAAG